MTLAATVAAAVALAQSHSDWSDLPACPGGWDIDLNAARALCRPSPCSCWPAVYVAAAIVGLVLIALWWWTEGRRRVRKFRITQVRPLNPNARERIFTPMPITGVTAGQSGTFTETPLPLGTKLPAGVVPSWSVDDTSVTLTPSADGTSCVAAVAATDTGSSFNLTASAALPNGTTITGTANVSILAPPPTSLGIDQTA